jgi:hypothetical protein
MTKPPCGLLSYRCSREIGGELRSGDEYSWTSLRLSRDLRSRELYEESGERVGSWIACGFVGCALVEIQAALKDLKDLHVAGRFFTSTTVTHQFHLSPYSNPSAYCLSDLAATYHRRGLSGDEQA